MNGSKIQSPFYRVSLKALIFDDKQRLLVFQDNQGAWEMPGGGWEHAEDMQECLSRELFEEAQVEVKSFDKIAFVYRCKHENGYIKLCLAVPVILASHAFKPTADDLVDAQFVSQSEFMSLNFSVNERGVLQKADDIWSLAPQVS